MAVEEAATSSDLKTLEKSPTGIEGLDEITGGGFPKGRPTLICGSAGCGKTLMALEFLVRGAIQYDEPGVFMSFEETGEELTANVASLGFDLEDLRERNKVAIDFVQVERSQIEETGEYDLEALFIRLGYAIRTVGAKRVVLDTLEALFGGLSNEAILRAELRRLFRWLKDQGVTAIITGERGQQGELTRQGLEEYVSDCVILLDHRIVDQISTRRLRIIKYRGSFHGTNEYPFVIDETGITVLPITSLKLDHTAPTQRVPSGIPKLDAMLEGKGFYKGSTILVSGTAGTGKTSMAAHFADAACRRGERCLYLTFEESPDQMVRNMRSIGVDLEPWIRKGLLHFQADRPTLQGLELHLATLHKLVDRFDPQVVVIDPITNLISVGTITEVKSLMTRVIDFLKGKEITTFFTSLTSGEGAAEETEVGVSSLVDAWLLLRDIEVSGERNRVLYLLKARGIAHSNQVREFLVTKHGIDLVDVYLGPAGVLTGSARLAQEAREAAEAEKAQREIELKQVNLERKRKSIEAQIAALEAEFEAEQEAVNKIFEQEKSEEQRMERERKAMAKSRRAVD